MAYAKEISSPEGLALVARVRSACASFPEVAEAVDKFGHTSFRVRNKPFVILGERGGGPSLSIKVDRYTQEFLLRRPEFERTPYIGQHGWVSMAGGKADDWTEIEELIDQAYRGVAPGRLMRALEEG